MQHRNVKSVSYSHGIVSPTRSSPIRLPVRERTYYDIETLLRSFFGNLRVDYAQQTPGRTRVDYAPRDLAAKCEIEISRGENLSLESMRPREITRWAGVRYLCTQIQILLIAKSLSRESDIS